MSLPRYPEYKDSGVTWLGVVPGHWNVLPCRAFVDEQTAKNDEGKNEDYLSLMANVGIIPYAEKGDVGNKKPEDLTKCKLVSMGDFVINSMNYGIGSYGLSALDGICSPVYIVLRPRLDRIESRYAFRIFENRAFQTYAQSFGNGILEHRAAINWDILKSIGVGIPPKEEQTSILNFLDRETGKIDALIAEQQRLVELLVEKRQAVISHAVTKGLNPNARMKDSGIEWLGEVPEHWEVVPLKQVIAHIESGVSVNASDFPASETELGVLKTSCVYSGQFDANENKTVIEAELDRVSCPLKAGTLIVSRMNTPELVGAAGLVKVAPESIFLPDRLWQVSFSNAAPAFVHYWTQSVFYRAQIRVVCAGTSSSMQNLGQDQFRSFDFPNPPQVEQQTIVAYLDTETAKFDTLTAEANRAIELLQERRSALISAAVTGKIDVREAA